MNSRLFHARCVSKLSAREFLCFLVCLLIFPGVARPSPQAEKRIPILLDTDIGSDIDDAFSVALILGSPELDLLGVTTVSGDTQARARLAAKMLWEAGKRDVPVAAGEPGKPLDINQTRWADGFTSPQLLRTSAVDFLKSQLDKRPGEITLVAIGPLTNIAALLREDPAAGRKIKRIVMMGGGVAHGYGDSLKPVPEYNIYMDVAAAQTVFNSKVPILMAPLDATAMLQMSPADMHRVFTHLTPTTNALTLLYHLWDHPTPTLFDPMAVALLIEPGLCETQLMTIEVESDGLTRAVASQQPNATVATKTDPKRFMNFYLKRVAP